ncbi:cell number regulator 6 [Hordeum vulgare]|nr:cell number regulator 6 [Hordeum vulgare]
MVIAPPHLQAKPSANIKQNDVKNKKKRQRAEEGEDSKIRVSDDSSAGSGSGNTESDNDFNPANGNNADEDESDRVRDDFSTKIDREEENKKAVKIFFLIFFNKVVYGTTFPCYNRAVMVKDMNYEDMAQMDFCQVIVETIQAGAIDWQKMKKGEKGNKDHIYGLAQGPVIMYLDSLLLPNTREMNSIAKKMNNSSTPRANYLDEKDLKKIAKEDMKMDGKGRPDDYEFGKIKAWLDKKQQTSATEFGSSNARSEDEEKQQGETTNEATFQN